MPICLSPLAGESLDSWLWAYADRLQVQPRDLLIALGIPGHAYRDYTVRLLPSEAVDVSWASGIDQHVLHAMTLARYDRRAIMLAEGERHISRFELMPRVTGTRYCPRCLKEAGGRWQLSWRLSWSFVCLIHRCLLVDHCPSCGAVPCGYRGIGHSVAPRCCTARIQGQPRKERCRADLSRAKTPTLRAGSRVLAAQQWLDALIAGDEPDDTVRAVLTDLATVSGRILTQGRPESVRQCGARFTTALNDARESNRIKHLRGLFPEENATLAAAALTAAVDIITSTTREKQLAPALRALVNADLETRYATNPLGYIPDWHFATEKMRSAVIDIYADSIAHVDALRLRAFSSSPRAPARSPTVDQRNRKIPELCWRRISLMLDPGITPEVFRIALSVALLLPGNTERDLATLASRLSSPYPGRTSYTLRLLRRHTGTVGFEAICRIADYLDEMDPVIDYHRRRQTVGPNLLPERTWLALCRDNDLERGVGGAKLRAARCYLYTTLTGTSLHQAPPLFHLPSNALRMHYESFAFRMDEKLAGALRDYSRGYLTDLGISGEPVTWQPPTTILDGLELPGPHPDSPDVASVHAAVTETDLSCSAVAELFGTNREGIRCLLADHPRPYREPKPRTVPGSSRRYREIRLPLNRAALDTWAQQGIRSTRHLAAMTGIDRKLIARRLRELDMPMLEPGGQAQFHVDRDWLNQRYVVDQRTHGQIADEARVSQSTIERLTAAYGIPNRSRGGDSDTETIRVRMDADRHDPPLRNVLTGRGAWSRLERFETIARCGSLQAAAVEMDVYASVLSTQLARLEHEAGISLWDRTARAPTHNGEQLLRQFRGVTSTKATPPPCQ
ncbi:MULTISPECIES: TniQ family protein [unclassified Rhodococcus (in: high G+C Gram-positive bacteria)]|uniref:TniQ family protein n=1 Tax=unclassified Rhodococcus (in: high G+C Gram-positive bacteria) TaxID=192944 RepID=UPI0015CE5623|nr:MULTISPECIES: TniQ family protein [unclassified Rhodococcus (in: high G+C Gram-positive bacteria)]